MKIKVILYGVGLTGVTGDRWKENARICSRIHLPIEGKAIYHDVRDDCVLAAEDAYLLINSSSANLELLPDTPYQHIYMKFATDFFQLLLKQWKTNFGQNPQNLL